MVKKHNLREPAVAAGDIATGEVAEQVEQVEQEKQEKQEKREKREEQPVEPKLPPESPDDGNNIAERLLQIEQELQQVKQEKDDHYARLLRCQADFDNFRRRSRQEYEQACLYGGEDLLKKILPVLDCLERAVASFSEHAADNSSWQDGVQLILKQFQAILAAEGLEVIEALERVFDPQVHEAVLQEQSDAVTEPTVVQELQKGYKFKNKLIRPAMVKVAVPK
ncbi:MAG: nucleotide exchange factor GrpE [Bacillota bacterium]|jgi:molecular chaperone GrpE